MANTTTEDDTAASTTGGGTTNPGDTTSLTQTTTTWGRNGGSNEAPPLAVVLPVAAITMFILVTTCLVFVIKKKKMIGSYSKDDIPPTETLPSWRDPLNDADIIIEEGSVGELTVIAESDALCMKMPPPKLIKLHDLQKIVQEERISREPFDEEYESMPRGQQASWSDGSHMLVKGKNRFKNIIAYDHSRVVLCLLTEDPLADYINANYIQGYDGRDMFIAAQGPTPYTVKDFWRMIWEQDSALIVMLTNLVEAGKIKCDQYWPDDTPKEFGDVKVSLANTMELPDFTVRTFEVTKDEYSHQVKQFHFTGWPDHGVPQHATGLLNFRRKVRAEMVKRQQSGPVIVHCSAGVGRTGAFLAIDYLIQQAEAEEQIDVRMCVSQLRKNRVNMVQTRDQYAFVYTALLEAIWVGETLIPCFEFSNMYSRMLCPDPYSSSTKLEQQFMLLESMKPVLEKTDFSVALDPTNIEKNRNQDIVPVNIRFPLLMTPVEGRTNYINAVFVDGRKQTGKFIATQMPLPDTVVDFWRMIFDYKCSCIIMLNTGDSDEEKLGVYWPQEDKPVNFDVISAALVKEVNTETCVKRDITVTNHQRNTSHTVRQFYYSRWPQDGRPDATDLFQIHEEAQYWQKTSNLSGPIVVHCLDGSQRTGVYMAISNLVDMMSVEQELDVFQVVQTIRTNRIHFITSQEQYRFLYEAAKMFMDTFSTYSNFS